MKIVSRYFAGIVIGLSLVASTAWAESVDIETIGGNPVVARANVDGLSNIFFMDTNNPFTAEGTITNWEIYALNSNQVALVIYRQIGGAFVEVGRSSLVTPAVGYNLFSLGRRDRIKVQPGDFVGAYYPGLGSISFSQDGLTPSLGLGRECDYPGGLEKAVAVTDQSAPNSLAFIGSCDRHYSLRAFSL